MPAARRAADPPPQLLACVAATPRARLLGATAPLLLVALVVATPLAARDPAALAATGPRRFGVDAATRQAVFAAIASEHTVFRARAAAHFPDHAWSREDDYHWKVRDVVHREVAPRFGLTPSQVWAIYDEGVATRQRPVVAAPGPHAATAAAADPLPAMVVPLQPRRR